MNARRARIVGSEQRGHLTVLKAEVPLASMFGYSGTCAACHKGVPPIRWSHSLCHCSTRLIEECSAEKRESLRGFEQCSNDVSCKTVSLRRNRAETGMRFVDNLTKGL